MNETTACQHCYARIIQVGDRWIDVKFTNAFCEGTDIRHRPMPDIRKEEHAN